MTGNAEIRNACSEQPTQTNGSGRRQLFVVAEGLHTLNHRVCEAVREQNSEELTTLARRHLAHGAHGLAVNLGPGRAMTELTPWVTETLCHEFAKPLFLSANGLAFPELLRRHATHLAINAVTADPATLPRALATAGECGTGLVVLLVRPGLTPAGSEDRLEIAAAVIDQAIRYGFPLRQLYLDPYLAMRPDPFAWGVSRGLPDLAPVVETIDLLRQMEAVHTVVALGNCAMAANDGDRAALQARVLTVLVQAGLDTVILNGQDPFLLETCRTLNDGTLQAEKVARAA